MPKYHITPDGDPAACRARTRCPYGDLTTDHYPSVEEARAGYEQRMKEWARICASTPTTVTSADLESMDEAKQRMTMGAVWRVLREMQWDDQGKDYWQAVYDSTDHGALWLERKRNDGNRRWGPDPEYVQRKHHLDAMVEADRPIELGLPPDPGDVLQHDFTPQEPMAFPEDRKSVDKKVKLALLSAAWMQNLTPEEAEAISWVTSNGASVLNNHINGKEHEIWGYEVYSKAHIDRSLDAFRRAMAKAPELEEPIVIYRGTSADRADWTHLDRPASASLDGQRASSFKGDHDDGTGNVSPPVLIEIRTRKVASVCGMGVHGVAEMEVLAPLGHYRKVADFETLRGQEGPRFGDRSAIDPKTDKIRVVQLEYIGP